MGRLESLANHLSLGSRQRKWDQFLRLVKPQSGESLLDVGVNTTEYSDHDNFLERNYPWPAQITALGIGADFSEFNRRYPTVRTVNGDGTCLPFADREFDITHSNAVIEHVGSHARQVAFARELWRVASRGFITTPNRLFPVEVHTRVPLAHLLLSKSRFDALLRRIGKGFAAGDYMNLLSETELAAVLKEAGIDNYTLIRNRVLGLPMTFTVSWDRSR